MAVPAVVHSARFGETARRLPIVFAKAAVGVRSTEARTAMLDTSAAAVENMSALRLPLQQDFSCAMMSELIPDDIRKFILENIDSIAELEALLLLRKNPDQDWTKQSLSKRLYIEETAAARALERIMSAGLCMRVQESYRFGPNSETKRLVVNRLADVYDRYLIPVTNFIHEKPARIQNFAEAFRFRKDK